MPHVPGPGGLQDNQPGLTATEQQALNMYNQGVPTAQILKATGMNLAQMQGLLESQGVNYSVAPPSTAKAAAPPPSGDPNNPFAGMTPAQIQAYIQAQAAQLAAQSGAGSAASSAAADLAEKKREFDVTTQRDIAKENAAEVDALQKMLAGLSGPKDVYADLFFSHGLMPPQGYKPAPVPLTQAQKDAYGAMGVNPQQLQQMITGTGQPGADTGYLGSLGSSLQTPAGMPGFQQAQAPTGAQQASNPTVQGGALYGKAPAGTSVTNTQPPAAPAPTPAMATGGEVPGPVGQPQLTVLHGGEQVNNNTPQGPIAPVDNAGVHPAIQKLMDALSELLANPDFKQFAGVAGKAASLSHKGGKGAAKGKGGFPEGSPKEEALETPQEEAAEQGAMQGPMAGMMPPGPAVTPGGVQAMAIGGTVAGVGPTSYTPSQSLAMQQTGRSPVVTSAMGGLLPNPTPAPTATVSPRGTTGAPPLGTGGPRGLPVMSPAPPLSGVPQAGAQGVTYNTGAAQPADNPVLPLTKMDPYARALYDVHGRLHPFSAQQWQQMGPEGQQAVLSYVGKVEGADPAAYQDLAKRLMPESGAPSASTGTNTGGFQFG